MPLLNNIYNVLSRYCSRHCPLVHAFARRYQSFARFVITGTITGGLDLLFLFIMHGLLHIGIVVSTSVSFLMSFFTCFYLQRVWAFDNHGQNHRVPRQFMLYMLNSFFTLNVNGFGMHLLVNKIHIWYLLSQIVVNLIIGGWNFLIYKFIIFRKDHEINCGQDPVI